MPAGVREFFNSPKGKNAALAVVVAGLMLAFWSIWSNLGPSAAASLAGQRVFITTTGQTFPVTVKPNVALPTRGPDGNPCGPAEFCFWTKDGQPKTTPTPVLLNTFVGKPGPTFCPDCGRLVVGHNPPAAPGVKPPPTQAEFKPRSDDR